jgi:hypothetical protein
MLAFFEGKGQKAELQLVSDTVGTEDLMMQDRNRLSREESLQRQ